LSPGEWYLVSLGVGAGASIALLWIVIIATGRLPAVAAGRADFAWHVAAELVTAAVLLIGGIGLLIEAAWGRTAIAVGLGTLLYAITESAGHYLKTGNRWLAVAVLSGWPFAIAAAAVLFS
jgi:hypothetical protein